MSHDSGKVRVNQYDDLTPDGDQSTIDLLDQVRRGYTTADPSRWLAGPPKRLTSQTDDGYATVPVPGWRGSRESGVRTPGHIEALQKSLHAPISPVAIRTSKRSRSIQASAALVTMLAALLLAVGVTNALRAGSSLTDLGKPMNLVSTNPYFPLSGFHRVKDSVRQGKKAEMLFLSASGDHAPSQLERWPVVKALGQFGTLSGVQAVGPSCTPPTDPRLPEPRCQFATFDFRHARYRSSYLKFSSKDLIRLAGHKATLTQRMSKAENGVFRKYVAPHGPLTCWHRSSGGALVPYTCHGYLNLVAFSVGHLPAVMVGDYLQTASQDLVEGDFGNTITLPTPTNAQGSLRTYINGFSFNTIHDALLHARDPSLSHIVESINAESNIMIALICHADGKRPRSVCGRSTIKTILKSVH